MDPSTWKKIETILDHILPLEQSERTQYIEKHVNDPELKREINALLEAELHAPRYLDKGVEAFFTGDKAVHDIAENISGKTFEIDRYKIEKEIGRGGMSVVYLAHRTDGEFDQKVAVKIIQPFGLDREDRFRRLRAERQILANLQHPNIARVFDGGITPEGWPYMVMEVVEGIPVTKYCQKKSLDLNSRLELFYKICDAVIYAHRNLVVHRDLKPGNILVTETGQVKLLDFGIAKLLTEDEGDPVTQTGRPLMTPEYAAPEQFKSEMITTAVDIYSLGVILYELLAGVRPYNLAEKSLAEMERLVCEEEPLKPSEQRKKPVRFSSEKSKTSDPTPKSVDSKPDRSPESPSSNQLKGDLDLICLKALRKEPEHRYKSVEEFREDLVRYQKGLPIQAHPSSLGYKTQKFIKRNKAPLAMVALFLIAITSFAIYHIYQVTEQRNIAQIEAEKATRIKNFTTNLFYSNSPYSTLNRDEGVTLEKVLEAGQQNIENELAGDPEVYAEMQFMIGQAFLGIGDYSKSNDAFEKAIETAVKEHGEIHRSVAIYLNLLGRLEGMRGNYESALSNLNRAMEINRQLYGDISSNLTLNYAEVARVYALQREFDTALEYYQKSIQMHEELGEKHSMEYNMTLSGMINLQIRLRMLDEAENNQLQAIEDLEKIYGENHLHMANAYLRMAEIHYQKSNFQESENFVKKSLSIREKLQSPDNPDLINTYNFLGNLYRQTGRYEESEKNLQHAIRLAREHDYTDTLNYTTYLNNLAVTKTYLGQLDSAAVIHQEVLDLRKRLLPPDNPSITLSMYNLGYMHHRLGNLNEAKTLFEQVVERDKRSMGEDHPEAAIDLVKLAAVYRDLNEFSNAETAFKEAEAIFNERFPENHHRIGEFYREYGRLKMMQQQTDQALQYLNKSMAIFKENYDDDHDDVKSVQQYLAALAQEE